MLISDVSIFTTGLCYICVFMHYVFVTAIHYIKSMLTKCTCYISHKTAIHPYKPQWQTCATDWRIYANAFKYQFQPMTDLTDFGKHDSQSLITRIHYGGSVEPCVAQHGEKNPQPHERSHFPNICENWRGWKVSCCHLISDKRVHERPNFSVLKNCSCWYCCEDNACRRTPAAL